MKLLSLDYFRWLLSLQRHHPQSVRLTAFDALPRLSSALFDVSLDTCLKLGVFHTFAQLSLLISPEQLFPVADAALSAVGDAAIPQYGITFVGPFLEHIFRMANDVNCERYTKMVTALAARRGSSVFFFPIPHPNLIALLLSLCGVRLPALFQQIIGFYSIMVCLRAPSTLHTIITCTLTASSRKCSSLSIALLQMIPDRH
jgi:hypothetical protein